jgi:glycosyltransferase involved in cell wall biosynthesis
LLAANSLRYPTERLLHDRQTVIVAVHEATRTGAPILAWNIIGELKKRYNVIALLKRAGPIEKAISDRSSGIVTLPADFTFHHAEVDALAQKLVDYYQPKYMIAISAETRYFVPSLERFGVPVIALIHEFASTVRPLGSLLDLIKTASQIVFSAQIVADSALAEYLDLAARDFKILHQGVCLLPPSDEGADSKSDTVESDLSLLPDDDGSVLVIGIGTITPRKGVEFFIAAAAGVQRQKPSCRITFAWVGKCYSFDQPYLDLLNEQIRRSGVQNSFVFLGEFDDLSPIYARANIYFLSSRLDPLPNVAIDSAIRGIPVICFDQGSGIAEILKSDAVTRDLVVPYADAEAAARRVVEMADEPSRLSAFSEAIVVVARERFNMASYAEAVDRLGCEAVQARAQTECDFQLIVKSEVFNTKLYLSPLAATMTTEQAIADYLAVSRLVAPRGRPRTGRLLRRPLEGFHPLIYASDNPKYDEATGEDPLAHYVRTGCPPGRWKSDVIRPRPKSSASSSSLRVAAHGHFHYPDLLPDFLSRLRRNDTSVDLILTTTSEDKAREIAEIVSQMSVQPAKIVVVPNRGRDIGSMLALLRQDAFVDYDVLGHFHGKRTPHVGSSISETWRTFLWENLVGGKHNMMDVVLETFANDENLGLVFPNDPNLNDWNDNRSIADGLAERMGLPLPLPNHFNFPQGTMFWARPQALKPLIDLGLTWDDYPDEPLPIDGTLLHALERLLPFSAAQSGYSYALTYVETFGR